MVHQFPTELIENIGLHLDQSGRSNFASTCRHISIIMIPMLYRAISIDASKKIYSNEVVDPFTIPIDNTSLLVHPSCISNIYALKLFLKNLIKNPHYARYITKIVFKHHIPDIGEFQLIQYLNKIIPNMIALKSFAWFNCNYNIDWSIITKVPRYGLLVELDGNFNLNEKSRFANIRLLNISNFKTTSNLSNVDLSHYPNLKFLVISKTPSPSNKFLQIPEHSSSTTPDDIDCISKLFQGSLLLNLESLTLKDIHLRPSDSKLLINSINSSTLKDLSLINCHEVLFEDDQVIRRTPPNYTFLSDLSFPYLETLNLKMTNELNFNIPTLTFMSRFKNLQRLNLYLQYNRAENINQNLAITLESIPNNKLTFLDLKLDLPDSLLKFKAFDYNIDALRKLSNFKKLTYLSLQINQYQITNLFKLVEPLKELKCLKLNLDDSKLNKSKSPENSLINAEVLQFNSTLKSDNFYHFNNLARDFKSYLPKLKWVQFYNNCIEDYIFECVDGHVQYREGISKVFSFIINQVLYT